MAAKFLQTMTVQLEYIKHLLQFSQIYPIMLALCSMLSVTYYAQNYAGIIGWSLMCVCACVCVCVATDKDCMYIAGFQIYAMNL